MIFWLKIIIEVSSYDAGAGKLIVDEPDASRIVLFKVGFAIQCLPGVRNGSPSLA